MLRISQSEGRIAIESLESYPAILRMCLGGEEVIKSLMPGHNVISCRGMPKIMDIELLALAKADVAPLYVARNVENAEDIIAWFKSQGFGQMLDPADMHCTICYSRDPVSWQAFEPAPLRVIVPQDQTGRSVAPLGKGPAAVLKFRSVELAQRHSHMIERGASTDYATYQPHITLSYKVGSRNLSEFQPFPFNIILGPEVYDDIDTDRDFIEKSVRRTFTWDRINRLRAK